MEIIIELTEEELDLVAGGAGTEIFQFYEHGIRDYCDRGWYGNYSYYSHIGQPDWNVYVLFNLKLAFMRSGAVIRAAFVQEPS